jgi:hypothetical protein
MTTENAKKTELSIVSGWKKLKPKRIRDPAGLQDTYNSKNVSRIIQQVCTLLGF